MVLHLVRNSDFADEAFMAKAQLTKWSKWYLVKSEGQWIIRRYRKVNGKTKWQRLAVDVYAHLRADEAALKRKVIELNGVYTHALAKAKEAYDIKHAIITKKVLEEFHDVLRTDIPTETYANDLMNSLIQNCLQFFIDRLKLPDLVAWKENQDKWARALLCELKPEERETLTLWKSKRSASTIKKNVQIANRFLKYLHDRFPRDIPLVKLNPVSPARLRENEKAKHKSHDYVPGKFISDDDWKVIEREIDKSIKPFVQLGYHLGLRRAETLGAKEDDVREGFFKCERQLEKMARTGPKFGPTKNRRTRKVPYWLTSADAIYDIIAAFPDRMHPDTFTDFWAEEMKRLGFDYGIHDLRRTWITRSLDTQPPHEVMRAAGHADLRTTMRYLRDKNQLSDKKFVPKTDQNKGLKAVK